MHRSIIRLLAVVFTTLPVSAGAMQTSGNKHVCFTLNGEDCALPIISVMSSAQHRLLIQTYNWTEPRINAAACEAKRRGVDVVEVLDKR